jgi:N-acetylglutamate synthase-like GNAT family acetyltransferase
MISHNASLIDRIHEMNPSVTLRSATRDDAFRFVELFNKHYNRKITVEYYYWQFFNDVEDSILFIAEEDDALIGVLGIKTRPLNIGVKSGFVIDFLIDEEYRKRGISILLHQKAVEHCNSHQIPVMSALPNFFGNAALKSLGWISLCRVDKLVWRNSTKSDERTSIHLTVNHNLICFEKGADFESWRYDQNPVYRYKKYAGQKDNYIVTKIFEDPVSKSRSLDIVDMHMTSSEEMTALIHLLIEKCKGDEIDLITTWALGHTSNFVLLSNLGFVSERQERFFCLRPSVDMWADIENPEKWDIQAIDAEIF